MARRTESTQAAGRWWLVLLLIPFIGTLWMPFYAHYNPTLWGLPFFYWYQFLWILISAALTVFVYLVTDRD